MPGLTDQVELDLTVAPALADAVELVATVFCDRATDSMMIEAQVVPLTADAVLLGATVINQELEEAAAAQVIAPAAEVIFL